jgi:hypothetical protein
VRELPDPGFAGDDGTAAPETLTALQEYDAEPGTRYDATLAVLQHARVLVPVVALLGEVDHDIEGDEQGVVHDKTSDMAAVLMTGRDGRSALLAFTGTVTMSRWDPQARPVPVAMAAAAEAAVSEGAEALVLDVAGPVTFVVETEDLRELAGGGELVRVREGDRTRYGWARASAHPEA